MGWKSGWAVGGSKEEEFSVSHCCYFVVIWIFADLIKQPYLYALFLFFSFLKDVWDILESSWETYEMYTMSYGSVPN